MLLFPVFIFSPCIQKADTKTAPPSAAETKTRSLGRSATLHETPWFNIVSYDPPSASFVADLGVRLGRWATSELRWDTLIAGGKIRVELVPRSLADWPEPYRINDHAGQITLYLRWTNDTDWDMVTLALSHAFLARVFQAQGCATPAATVPHWLATACSRELAAQSTPGLLEDWTHQARTTPPVPLAIFTEEKKRDHALALSAPALDYAAQTFWFWRHLRREMAEGKTAPRILLIELARGQSLEDILARYFSAKWRDPAQRALWWPIGYQQIIRERTLATFSMTESREYLTEVTRFIFSPGGTDQLFSPPELPALRHLPVVREEVARRQRQLKLDIARANPVWHNAWRAYGVFLENFPRADEVVLHRLWVEAEEESNRAGALEYEITRLLQQADE